MFLSRKHDFKILGNVTVRKVEKNPPDLVTLHHVNLHMTQTVTCELYYYGLGVNS